MYNFSTPDFTAKKTLLFFDGFPPGSPVTAARTSSVTTPFSASSSTAVATTGWSCGRGLRPQPVIDHRMKVV